MKQIYAYITLATIVTFSTSCMELERTQKSGKTVTNNIQDKKPLLQTNNLIQPDKNLIKDELYTWATKLDKNFDSSKLTTHKSLINFITLMNQAKRHNINEYDMASFSYGENRHSTPTYASITLSFHCLKKYNDRKEELPFTADDLNNEFCFNSKLAQALKISYKYYSMQDIENTVKNYPAYTQLINKLKIAAASKNYPNYRSDYYCNQTLCIGMHSGVKRLLDGYSQYNNITDFDGFYVEACSLRYPCYENLYLFITLVERIKTIEKEIDEKDFFSKVLNYQPKPKEFFGFNYVSFDTALISTSTKNTIALMYTCVEQCHSKRGDKITPTSAQHKAFLAFKRLDIDLPDNFDKSVFDETRYAFKEFETLTDNMATIHSANGDALEQSIKKLLQ